MNSLSPPDLPYLLAKFKLGDLWLVFITAGMSHADGVVDLVVYIAMSNLSRVTLLGNSLIPLLPFSCHAFYGLSSF